MELIEGLYGILVIFFVIYILWSFGHKEEWGSLVKKYKYEGPNPDHDIKDKTVCLKSNNKWTTVSTIDLFFNNEGLHLTNHTFLFRKLIPTVKIPWENIKFLGRKRFLFFKGPHIIIEAQPPVELILPKSSKEYVEKYVGN